MASCMRDRCGDACVGNGLQSKGDIGDLVPLRAQSMPTCRVLLVSPDHALIQAVPQGISRGEIVHISNTSV